MGMALRNAGWAAVAVAVAEAAAAAAPAQASASGPLALYYERSLMSAAHARCGLFSGDIAAALDASAAQARGAALRGGADMSTVRATFSRASARVDEVGCASPDLKIAAQRVRSAFEIWSKTARMSWPGESATWTADRTAYRSAQWKLVQPAKAGQAPVRFGLGGRGSSAVLLAVADFGPGARPYAARLVFRDVDRAPAAWLGAPANRPLPPRSASRVLLARDEAAAEAGLSPGGRDGSLAFRFPDQAVEALAGLDPRERFAVEFVFPGERVQTAALEVGDFAAGRAFLRMGSR